MLYRRRAGRGRTCPNGLGWEQRGLCLSGPARPRPPVKTREYTLFYARTTPKGSSGLFVKWDWRRDGNSANLLRGGGKKLWRISSLSQGQRYQRISPLAAFRIVIRDQIKEWMGAVDILEVGDNCGRGFAIGLLSGGHLLRLGLFSHTTACKGRSKGRSAGPARRDRQMPSGRRRYTTRD